MKVLPFINGLSLKISIVRILSTKYSISFKVALRNSLVHLMTFNCKRVLLVIKAVPKMILSGLMFVEKAKQNCQIRVQGNPNNHKKWSQLLYKIEISESLTIKI